LKLVSDCALARLSAFANRRDVKMELNAGFPYSIPHAAALAELFVQCLFPSVPKKGLITDLDDTLWKGILGDVGVNAISWSLDGHAHVHAVYQQLLASLADSGVLIAVASKNDPALVQEAFARPDILLKEAQVFPIESNWGAKSASVGRILRTWNISSDSVVFVDDSPLELAEVAASHPALECLRFPSDPSGTMDLLNQLRDRFAKMEIREEDHLRLGSVRRSAALESTHHPQASAAFLADLGAKLTLQFTATPNDGRAFELVNKTNQFNLNAQRYTESEWQAYFQRTGAFLLTANYEDRFGPLGKITVLAGWIEPRKVHVDIWVMSCRAFSRQIEFQLVQRLYERFGADRIEFAFRRTQRNGPMQEFLSQFFPPSLPKERLELEASVFANTCPPLFHQVIECSHGQLI
jgi:FkbH-like protein